MGKKNKMRDIWDLTPEEQSKQAEDLFAIENGKLDILSLANIDKGINDNGFSQGLESAIVKDILGSRDKVISLNDDEPVVGKTNMEKIFEESKPSKDTNISDKHKKNTEQPKVVDTTVNSSKKDEPVNPTVSKDLNYIDSYNGLRPITFELIEPLNRVIINDSIAPTTYSLDIGLTQDIDGSYDAENVADLTNNMLQYIISLKHPTAMYEYYDFINKDFWKFASVKEDKYDHSKYMFFRAGGYVLCYIIDNESLKNLYEKIDEYTNEDILKTFIGMSYAAGTFNQAFFVEDDWYVKVFMNSDLNKQKEFHKLFSNDLSTLLVSKASAITNADGVDLIDIPTMQSYIRETIGKITGSLLYDDDDDDDDEDDADDIQDSTDYQKDEEEDTTEPDEDDNNDDDASDLMSDEMTDVDTEDTHGVDKIEPSDEDDFVIPVVRKK